MTKKIVWILLFGIIILAGILRFWQLGSTPISPDWDEVSLGYNAYSILHTGKDEFGVTLPIVLRSYGDYKPALYSYLDIPAIAILGLNVFAVRLPSAIFGVLTVLMTFFLVKELFRKDSLALAASFLLSISPWHLQFSRVAFESNIGLSLNVLGALLFLKALKRPWLFIPSALTFGLTIYAYQSDKVFTPLLVIFLVLLFSRQLIKLSKKYLAASLVVGVIVVAPMVGYTLFGQGGLARATGVSIFSSTSPTYKINMDRYQFNIAQNDKVGLLLDNGRFVYLKTIVGNYLTHFDLNWLFILGDIGRHHAPDMGLLYLWELPFVGIGIYQLLFGHYESKTKIFVFGWLLMAPLPAAITMGVPHAVRTLNSLPMYQILTAIGVLVTLIFLSKKNWRNIPYGYMLIGIFAIIALVNFIYYLDQYFVQLNHIDALDWQYGYTKIVPQTLAYAKTTDHVVVSSQGQFDESYMFFLFYMKYDPALYQKQSIVTQSGTHSFGKFTFRPIDWANNTNVKNTLFIGNISDFPSPVLGLGKIIYTNDGVPFAQIVKR